MFCSKYWVGLHMESSAGGSSEFHWGDCVISADITNRFNSLTNYAGDTACGYVNQDSLRLTACSNPVSLGFVCENPNGKLAQFDRWKLLWDTILVGYLIKTIKNYFGISWFDGETTTFLSSGLNIYVCKYMYIFLYTQ